MRPNKTTARQCVYSTIISFAAQCPLSEFTSFSFLGGSYFAKIFKWSEKIKQNIENNLYERTKQDNKRQK